MKKLNILLVCNAGMSTSLLVNKVKEYADKEGYEINIVAMPVDEVSSNFEDKDVVLLGPQVRFKKKAVEEQTNHSLPVDVIDMVAYGTIDGKKVFEQALELAQQ